MKTNISNSEIIEMYHNIKSCAQIAKIFNCDPETIRLRLKKEGVNTSKNINNINCVYCDGKTQKVGKHKHKQKYFCLCCNKYYTEGSEKQEEEMLKRHEQIKKMYLEDNLSTTEIGKLLGCSSTVPQRILKKYKLTREISYAKELVNANNVNLSHDEYIKRLPVFKKYKKDVMKITNKQQIYLLENYEKRGSTMKKDAFHLDHKYSVFEGFKNGISPEIIGNIENLEFIPWKENLRKNSKSSITIENLVKLIQPQSDVRVKVKS